MSQCKAYSEKPIHPDLFLSGIPVCCGNCLTFNGERCRDETVALNMNDAELMENLKLCDW